MGNDKVKIISTIEARMTSSRLPGKVLMNADGKPMLKHLTDRLKKVSSIDGIVLATTINSADDLLVDFAKNEAISFYRGSEDDVMHRVIEAAKSVSADIVVEITGDCPLIDPDIIEQTIQMFIHNDVDYVSNIQIPSYPIGMDSQVFKINTLEKSFKMTNNPLDHEHVTKHIRENPQIFSQIHLVAPPKLWWPELALTLDEDDDYKLLKKIIEHFGLDNNSFSCYEIIELIKQKGWTNLNSNIYRKGLNE